LFFPRKVDMLANLGAKVIKFCSKVYSMKISHNCKKGQNGVDIVKQLYFLYCLQKKSDIFSWEVEFCSFKVSICILKQTVVVHNPYCIGKCL